MFEQGCPAAENPHQSVLATHLVLGVLTAGHHDVLSAAIGPLVLDGLMTICGLALLTNARQHGCSEAEGR